MDSNNSLWVLGHKIRPLEISGNYDMVIGETPAMVPGPPPHYHTGYHESFLILEGEMEFMVNGENRTVRKGESVDLTPNTLHTFSNKSNSSCKWVNIHSPKGFLLFFNDVGVTGKDTDGMKNSISESIIQKVMQTAADYDMHIKV